jgi:hypothetical protein
MPVTTIASMPHSLPTMGTLPRMNITLQGGISMVEISRLFQSLGNFDACRGAPVLPCHCEDPQ